MPRRAQNLTDEGSPPCSPQMPTLSSGLTERPFLTPISTSLADAFLVEYSKGIGLDDAVLFVVFKEFGGVVAREAKCHLGKVVGAE